MPGWPDRAERAARGGAAGSGAAARGLARGAASGVGGQGLPSAEDLDRAEALRAAVADLPAGQRRAVELCYYADLPACGSPIGRRG